MGPKHIAGSLGLLALVTLCCAFAGSDKTSAARRDANRFILEKLNRQSGDGWARAGQFFLWNYQFSAEGCELTMTREAVDDGNLVRQVIPIADVVPVWQGGASIALYCQSNSRCIDLETKTQGEDNKSGVGDTSVLAPMPEDLPKLQDAFTELHRLCDDAYAHGPRELMR